VTVWLGETLVAVTALMLLVLALRGAVARAFGAGWAYALWAIPAARLVLPPIGLVSLSFSPAGSLIPPAGGVTALPPAEAGPGQWVPFMLASWAGGAVIFLILQWLGYRAFLRRLRSDARPARPAFYEGIATLVSRVVEGPIALGLLRRLIVIPADFTRRYSPSERRLAMAHERAHHRRGDLWWNVAALVFLAANWFNPVAWIAFRAFRSDQELACDAAVAARASAHERCDYARALVKAATRPGVVAACAMSDTGGLKRRLRMIASHRASPIRSAGGFGALLTVALAGFAVAADHAPPPAPPTARPQLASAVAAPARLARVQARVTEEEDEPVTPVRRTMRPAWPAPAAPLQRAAADAPALDLPEAVPAVLPPPQPAPDVRPVRFVVRHARAVALEQLDPAIRARVEEAIARSERLREGNREAVIRYASADSGGGELPVTRTFIFQIRINTNDQGE
jgi:bla regulator protein BlaR1